MKELFARFFCLTYENGLTERTASMHDIPDDVLKKAAGGDIGAFEVIYKAFAGFVYNVAYGVLRNAGEAEEVVQEVFPNAYRQLRFFRSQSSVKTWIYRITVNCAINRYKKIARETEKQKEYGNNFNAGVLSGAPESAGDSESRRAVIDGFLDMLNPDQRACVVLRNVEGFSYRQIADALKVNINTVRTRLARAREKMIALRKGVMTDGL